MRESHATACWHAVVGLLLRNTDNSPESQAFRELTNPARCALRRASIVAPAGCAILSGCAGPDAVDAIAIAAIFAPLAGAWVLVRCRG